MNSLVGANWEDKRMRIHEAPLSSGIVRTSEFERKRLAPFAVNVGVKYGHGCLFCSTGSVLRMLRYFKELGEDLLGGGYAIVDPDTPRRAAEDTRRIRARGMVQLCTLVDAWAPEAQEHDLGRRCLEAILSEPGWTVRILTKNAAVRKDFDLIERYRDRVLVGLSITATPDKETILGVIEPNASSIPARMETLKGAARRGLRTYGMFCPLLPGIADSSEQIDELIQFAVSCQAEEVFVEAVNPRGPGFRRCQEALELWGYQREAEAVGRIRHKVHWSRCVADLIAKVQQSMRRFSDIGKLRYLLHPSRLTDEDRARIASDDAGVIWLGKA